MRRGATRTIALAALVVWGQVACGDAVVEVVEVRDTVGTGDVAGADTSADVSPDATPSDVTAPTDGIAPADVNDTSGPGDAVAPDGTPDGAGDTTQDAIADAGDTSWTVDPGADWALGRPMSVASSDGAGLTLGSPVLAGDGRAYVAVRLGSGNLVADGRTFVAPDDFAHAAVMRLEAGEDGLSRPQVMSAVYVDGASSAPELPRLAVCDGALYVTVNDGGGQLARLLKLSLDLETVSVAQFQALATLGASVRLGAPVCGGPGFVVTLDAFGGAIFTGPDGKSSQFSAEQTANRTLMVNGARVFGDNPTAQTVSATGMRMIHLARGAGQKILYVGEATIERVLGENTTLQPGDQLVYQHDFATSTGGSVASQGFFGREDITLIAGAADGRFAVAWTDVETASGAEVVEIVVTAFSATGARLWAKRSASWAVDALAFGADGALRIAGRFRSLEHIGVAAGPVGSEDAFLAVLDAESGERQRHVTRGWATLSTRPLGLPLVVAGAGSCEASALDAVMVRAEGVWELVGVQSVEGELVRCATRPLIGGAAELVWAGRGVGGAASLWVGATGLPDGLDGGGAAVWPSGLGVVGPVRGRLVTRL